MSEIESPRLLCLWAHPRSRSTAFERMMMERGDFYVLHEPFCTLIDTGRVEVRWRDEAIVLDSVKSITDFMLRVAETQNVFLKETCEYHYRDLLEDVRFLCRARHAIIIREPRATINSHYAVNPKVTCEQIGYTHLAAFKIWIEEKTGQRVLIVDSDELAQQPEMTVRAYCATMGIEFRPDALHWSPTERPEWSRTAKWHAVASKSSGFGRIETDYGETIENNETLKSYYKLHQPIYEALLACKPASNSASSLRCD